MDSAFYALDQNERPLYVLVADWIQSSQALRVVPDDDWQGEMETLCKSNPNAPFRSRARSIASYDFKLTDNLAASISLAVGQLNPKSALIRIGNGAYHEVGDAQRMCFHVETATGKKWAVLLDDVIALHDYIEHQNAPIPSDLSKVSQDDISNFKPPDVGQELTRVSVEDVAKCAALAKSL